MNANAELRQLTFLQFRYEALLEPVRQTVDDGEGVDEENGDHRRSLGQNDLGFQREFDQNETVHGHGNGEIDDRQRDRVVDRRGRQTREKDFEGEWRQIGHVHGVTE